MEKINCPLFEKKTVLKNYIKVKDYSNTQEEFTIVSCETTNFLFTNPRTRRKGYFKNTMILRITYHTQIKKMI